METVKAMNLMERIPKDFYKLFASKYTDYYMMFLTAIYEEMSLSYSVLGLTEKECRAVMNEKIASAALLWDEENYDEEGVFLTRSNMASVCLKHFEEWGWLKQDYDETLNSSPNIVRCMSNCSAVCLMKMKGKSGKV